MTVRRGALAGVAATAILVVSGCSSNGETSAESTDGASEASAGETVTVEHMYGPTEVTVTDDMRVVAMGWSDAEAALALGVEPVAVNDWLSFGEENHGVGPWAADLFEETEPTVIPRAETDIDYEQIQSLEPDLILNVNSDYDEAAYDRLNEIAPTISGPEGALPFAPGWEAQTSLVAEALGREERGEELIAETENAFAEAAEEYSQFEGVEAVTASAFGGAYGLHKEGDLRWDILDEIGFDMYGPAADVEPTNGFYADISAEQVEVFDAEVAVMFTIGGSLEELTNDPLISSLSVVEDNRAVFLEPEGEVVNAMSAGSVLSIPVAIDGLTPELAEAVENVGSEN